MYTRRPSCRLLSTVALSSLLAAGCLVDAPENSGESQQPLYGSFKLASEEDSPGGVGRISTDAVNVFWMAQGDQSVAVRRVSKLGGAVTTLATRPNEQTMDLLSDRSGLYWLTFGVDPSQFPSGDFIVANVLRVDPIDGNTSVVVRDAGKEAAYALAADAFDLYWVKSASIRKLSKRHPGSPSVDVVPSAPGRNLTSIALDQNNVYYTDLGAPNPATGCTPGEGKVWKISKSGGAPSALVTGESCPTEARVDAAFVYWVTLGGELRRVRKTGGAATTLATGVQVSQPKPGFDLAEDLFDLYFASVGSQAGTTAVFRMSRLIPIPIELASTESPQLIENVSAVDLTSIYYVLGPGPDGGALSIMRAPRYW